MAEVDAKALRRAVKARGTYLDEHRNDLTLKSLRRLLEADLQLPEKALDEEPHKSAIKALVDQLMRLILEAHAETAAAAEEAAAKRAAKKAKRAAEASDDFADENTRGKGATARGSPGDIAGKASKKEAPATAPKLGGSARALALKATLKAATISVPPALYKAAGDEGALCASLAALLSAEGLTADATPAAIAAVRARRELARDLDGIDARNIVQAAGRPRRAAAAAAVAATRIFAQAEGAGAGSDDDDDDADARSDDAGDAVSEDEAAPKAAPRAAPAPLPAAPKASTAGASPPVHRKRVLRLDEWDDDDDA